MSKSFRVSKAFLNDKMADLKKAGALVVAFSALAFVSALGRSSRAASPQESDVSDARGRSVSFMPKGPE